MDKKKNDAASSGEEQQIPTGAPAGETAEAPAVEADPIKKLEEALVAKEAEAAANWDRFLRERADLENFRKRTQKEKEELLKYGNENLILEILPAIDNMERALAHAAEETQAAVIEGVRMTLNMLLAALKKYGVTPVDATPGVAFDPTFHQAMCQVPTADSEPNTVVEEMQKGYLLNERLLRPAMVSVAAPVK